MSHLVVHAVSYRRYHVVSSNIAVIDFFANTGRVNTGFLALIVSFNQIGGVPQLFG